MGVITPLVGDHEEEAVDLGKGNPFLALRLAPEQNDALRARAAESGRTVSDVVRNAITDFLDGSGMQPTKRDTAGRRRVANPAPCPRQPSRPTRLQRAIAEIEDLLADYEAWQERLPESLQDGSTAVALSEAIDNLAQASDLLNATIPPRGFGRD